MMLIPLSPLTIKVTLPVLDPDKAKKFEQVKATLQSALDSIKSSAKNNDVNAQRRAMAQQRIAQIKQSIKSLRQIHGLDAKATARMIAQLAKQLAQAVKEYAAAGGSDNAVSSAPATSAPVQSSGDSNAAKNNTSSSSGSSDLPDDAGTASSTPQAAAVNAYAQTQNIAQKTTVNGSDEEDRNFLKDVNEIKNDLRNFAKQLRNSIKSRFMPQSMDPDLKDVRAIDTALDEVDRGVASISK